jgi:hypothetical protein
MIIGLGTAMLSFRTPSSGSPGKIMQLRYRVAEIWVIVVIAAVLIGSAGILAALAGHSAPRVVDSAAPSWQRALGELLSPATAWSSAAVQRQLATTGGQVSAVELTSPNAQSGGTFGFSVAVSGTTGVVGAPFETASGHADAGNAYVFDASTGALLSTLTSPNAQTLGEFGYSVAIAGNTVVVGAPDEVISGNTNAGHVYTFDATTGAVISRFHSPTVQTKGYFGLSVAISGTTVAVGAPGQNYSAFAAAGQVDTFSAKTGKLLSTLTSPNAQTNGAFGCAVAISGTTLVIGALTETASGKADAGHAYLLDATTSTLLATLTSPNVGVDGEFGNSVAIDGMIAAVGAANEKIPGYYGAGHAYTFNATNGALLAKFHSPNVQDDGFFGFSVAVSGTTVVVGAAYETVLAQSEAGRVYTFDALTGARISTLVSPNAQDDGQYGYSAAMSGTELVIGAPFESAYGLTGGGIVYAS